MDRARLRSGPSGNVVVMIDRPAGAVNAALRPLMKRLAMSSGAEATGPPSRGAREHVAPAQRVGGAPAEEEQTAVAQDVAADDPLESRGGQVEFGTDGRQ